MKSRGPRVVDLFAGAGLLSGAFQAEGYDIRLALERDSDAVGSYRCNVGDHVQACDVEQAVPSGHADVIIAGPPCQGFSTLGSMNQRDPRNRLTLQIPRWTRTLRPKAVVIENVAAFLQAPVWEELSARLEAQGYQIFTLTLNAVDFGVAQNRIRSFTVATKRSGTLIPIASRDPRPTVRRAWRGLRSIPKTGSLHVAPVPSDLALARMKAIPHGGDKRDILRKAPDLAPPSWANVRSEVTDVWGRMRWDAPANTLRTCFQNPSKGRYIHPDKDRVITLREGARLQSIPDHWRFCGSRSSIARQIGNGVPILLGRAVAKALLTMVE